MVGFKTFAKTKLEFKYFIFGVKIWLEISKSSKKSDF